MPNWCSNSITIAGPTETIKQLWEDAQTAGADGDFGLLEAMAPIGEWEYGTAVDTWGTKWDISDEGLEFTDNGDGTAEITGWFDSAWAPPIGAYEKFCDDMDNCEISASYFEPGMDFAGFWHGMEEHLDDLHDVWKNDPDNELFCRLDEEYNLVEQFEEYEEEFSEE
jgi:hypothetical protein